MVSSCILARPALHNSALGSLAYQLTYPIGLIGPKCQVAQATAERDETWKALVEQLQKENEGLTREAAGMLFPHQVNTHQL